MSDNILVHFTTNDILNKIKNDGYIKPKNKLVPSATGGDVDKVSCFRGFEYNDIQLLIYFKGFFAELKNSNIFNKTNFTSQNICALLIDTSNLDISIEVYPKQKYELILSGIRDEYLNKIGVYVKSISNIPFSTVIKIL